MIVVFLNNKLISCDTILPVMMELHERTGRFVQFYTTDAGTFDGIRNNFVLWDAIHRIGRLTLLGRRHPGRLNWLSHRIGTTMRLGWLALRARVGLVDIFHFRALNELPLRLLFIINRRRTYYCESSSFGEPTLMAAVGNIGYSRSRDSVVPACGRLLAFHPDFRALKMPELQDVPKYLFGPTRIRRVWLDYARERAPADFEQAFRASGLAPSDRIVVLMLGFFGPLGFIRDGGNAVMRALFDETLDAMAECLDGLPVFIKPHVFTNMDVVNAALQARPDLPATVTYLHPSVLATRAIMFVANSYSTTLADGHVLGVPTIEYTDYCDEALKVTDGSSMRPEMVDHFINRDPAELRRTLRHLVDRPREPLPIGTDDDATGFFAAMHGGAA